MGYVLEAVVAPERLLRNVPLPAYSFVVPLRQGIAMVPMIHELLAVLDRSLGGERLPAFRTMPDGFGRVLTLWSATGPVAYVEAEFFGGLGTQCAAVWDGGRLVFGPVSVEFGKPLPPEGSPISQALRRLGVSAPDGYLNQAFDEFGVVGLGRHRQTRHWITEVTDS